LSKELERQLVKGLEDQIHLLHDFSLLLLVSYTTSFAPKGQRIKAQGCASATLGTEGQTFQPQGGCGSDERRAQRFAVARWGFLFYPTVAEAATRALMHCPKGEGIL